MSKKFPINFKKSNNNLSIKKEEKYNVDEYALKYIVGHKITDITERVYTDRDIEWLKEEMSKVK